MISATFTADNSDIEYSIKRATQETIGTQKDPAGLVDNRYFSRKLVCKIPRYLIRGRDPVFRKNTIT